MRVFIYVKLWVVLLFSVSNVMSQELPSAITKTVKIVRGDSIIRTEVRRVIPDKFKREANKRYYWYSKNSIESNLGDYHGNLLHGKFELLFKNQLIAKGDFENGLKDGVWKYWNLEGKYLAIINWKEGYKVNEERLFYDDGKLKELFNYRKGLRHGWYEVYNSEGNLIERGKYKNNKKNGKILFYQNGKVEKKKYKKGELIPVKVKKEKVQKKPKTDRKSKRGKGVSSKKQGEKNRKEKSKFDFKSIFRKKEKTVD